MDKKKIIYITKKALLNLPDDIPIYVLLDPDPPVEVEKKSLIQDIPKCISEISKKNGSAGNISSTPVNELKNNNKEVTELLSKLEQSNDSISIVEIKASEIARPVTSTPIHDPPMFIFNDFEDLNDEFITSIEIETSNVPRSQNDSPDFVTRFYDSLYKYSEDNSNLESSLQTEEPTFAEDFVSESILTSKINDQLFLPLKDNKMAYTPASNEIVGSNIENSSDQSKLNKMDIDSDIIADIDSSFKDTPDKSATKSKELSDFSTTNTSSEFVSDKSAISNVSQSTSTVIDKCVVEALKPKTEPSYPPLPPQTEFQTKPAEPEVIINSIESYQAPQQPHMAAPSKHNEVVNMFTALQNESRAPQAQHNFSVPNISTSDFYFPPPQQLPVSLSTERGYTMYNTPRKSQDELNHESKSEEIKKIKNRRRMEALKDPKVPIEFKPYKFVEMDLNEKYMIYLNKSKKIVIGAKTMKDLEDEFEEKILNRSKIALEGESVWEPLKRMPNINKTGESKPVEVDSLFSSDEDDGSDDEESMGKSVLEDDGVDLDEDGDGDEEDSDEEKVISSAAVTTDTGFTKAQLQELVRIEKKVAETRRRLSLQESRRAGANNNSGGGANKSCNYGCRRRARQHKSLGTQGSGVSAAKKPRQSMEYLTIQEGQLQNNAPVISAGRSVQQQAEINHKLKHPRKLHPDIWYNETGELNDGPACSCESRHRIGPLHNDYPGEMALNRCQPNSNNHGQLHHYRLIISPADNFLSASPTTLRHRGKLHHFAGFSVFTHRALENLPVCQVVRYNIVYQLSLEPEDFPLGFTVRSLDLITDYLFTELLELLDVDWWPNNTTASSSCRSIHLLPRFERPLSGGGVKLLSTDVILRWLLDNASQPLCDVIDLPRIHRMSLSDWSQFIDPLRGTLATFPGKKPSTIRVDQVDRDSLERPVGAGDGDSVITFPVIVHMNMVPLKLGLTREPAYKRLLKNFLKLQYLILNRPQITKEDRTELNNLARLLENFEMNGIQRREFTVEINSDGFYRTGIKTDMVQFALCIPSVMSHVRFHFSLSELEDRLKYRFKDKSLLHQALTHPSYRNTNYGTNPDHYQNTNISCGLRHIEYGDKISLYRSFRKKGLSKMVQVMSYMPFRHETRSSIFGNERLECLGDAVIELITSVHLFYMFPELSEGHLDSFRQALVQNHYLADLAIRLGFHKYLLYTHNTDFSFDSTITHARSDAFEAVMASITLDGGLDEADRIFGSALFGDDSRLHKVWCELPEHTLQQQFPRGDRHVIQNSPIFKNLTKLEDRVGINFTHIRLLAKAMTIRKTGYNVFTLGDNQRLEFLGDSLLKYVTTDYLFKHFPRHHEGHLSLLRNTLVNRYTQARVCRELGLDEFVIRKDPTASANSNSASGGPGNAGQIKASQKPHADLLEAFLGALFVDKDLSWVERFCQICFWPRLVHFILNQKWNDPKSRLQQCCLTYRSLHEDPEIAHYKLISTYGSTDNREFKVAVYYRSRRLATGFGSSIQIAEMNAANIALDNYKDTFKQLGYQEKVINQHYDDDVRQKMLHQFENWDTELVDRFVDRSRGDGSQHGERGEGGRSNAGVHNHQHNYSQQRQQQPHRSYQHQSSPPPMHRKLAPHSDHKDWHMHPRYHARHVPDKAHPPPQTSDNSISHPLHSSSNQEKMRSIRQTSTLGHLLKDVKAAKDDES